jgi:hypothetical protein
MDRIKKIISGLYLVISLLFSKYKRKRKSIWDL